ncbi:MAG: DUF998 domain-containing protein, partial [Thermoplasmata archaeon]|nr:DUF998 domain-containing protein [Thermoplasmata archaeon]
MIVVQWKYPGYSDFGNYVSDLGSSNSPWAWLFNDSIRILGLLTLGGAYLLFRAFPRRTSSRLGVALLMMAGVGAIGVGTFPEGSPELGGGIHSLVSLVTFLGSALSLIVLSLAMLRDTRWD